MVIYWASVNCQALNTINCLVQVVHEATLNRKALWTLKKNYFIRRSLIPTQCFSQSHFSAASVMVVVQFCSNMFVWPLQSTFNLYKFVPKLIEKVKDVFFPCMTSFHLDLCIRFNLIINCLTATAKCLIFITYPIFYAIAIHSVKTCIQVMLFFCHALWKTQ